MLRLLLHVPDCFPNSCNCSVLEGCSVWIKPWLSTLKTPTLTLKKLSSLAIAISSPLSRPSAHCGLASFCWNHSTETVSAKDLVAKSKSSSHVTSQKHLPVLCSSPSMKLLFSPGFPLPIFSLLCRPILPFLAYSGVYLRPNDLLTLKTLLRQSHAPPPLVAGAS